MSLDYYNVLEFVYCCILSHWLQEYWDRYIQYLSKHPDQEQSDNCLYCLIFDLQSDMYMYALMKQADHFFRQLCR